MYMYSSYTHISPPPGRIVRSWQKSTTFNPDVVIKHNFRQEGVNVVNILNHSDLEYLTCAVFSAAIGNTS